MGGLITDISIHAPRVGSDGQAAPIHTADSYFNPRSPRRERRFLDFLPGHNVCISIHAPRVGSDGADKKLRVEVAISIHAPRVGSDCFAMIMKPP